MIFVDQDGARYQGRREPGSSATGQSLALVPEPGGELRQVEPHGLCPFFLLEATLDERARLDRAQYHLRSAPTKDARRRP